LRRTQEYRQFGSIQKQIEKANQELALINMATIKKQQAITVVGDLLNRGVTESQIVQLINFAGADDSSKLSSSVHKNEEL
jgi:adenine/guanine phosphoribosyltransferase-like PRPP-binding protein